MKKSVLSALLLLAGVFLAGCNSQGYLGYQVGINQLDSHNADQSFSKQKCLGAGSFNPTQATDSVARKLAYDRCVRER